MVDSNMKMGNISGYVSTGYAAKAAGVTQMTIIQRARGGWIPGAIQMDNCRWFIPEEWAELAREEKEIRASMVSVTEAAKMAGVSREAIYMALKAGRIQGRTGRKGEYISWRVDIDSLNKYIANRAQR